MLALEEQSPSKQTELCDVQADSFMRGKRYRDSEEFWGLVSEEKYPKLNYGWRRGVVVSGSVRQ